MERLGQELRLAMLVCMVGIVVGAAFIEGALGMAIAGVCSVVMLAVMSVLMRLDRLSDPPG